MHRPPSFCAQCGGKDFTAFVDETLFLDAETAVSGLKGYRCNFCGEEELDDESHARFADATTALVRMRRAEEQTMLRRVRKKLGLTQKQASALSGGGHNAFSRYERGETSPVAGVINLFKILDKHPELLDEIRA